MKAVATFRHTEAQNTNGGTATAGAWENRKLNNVLSDLNLLFSLDAATGIVTTLRAGFYYADFLMPYYNVNRAQSRIIDADSSALLILGSTALCNAVAGTSCIRGLMQLAQNQRFVIQSRVETSRATDGYGVAANFTTEVYTVGQVSVLG